jgi:hypothetical protein
MVVLALVFWGRSIMISVVAGLIYIPLYSLSFQEYVSFWLFKVESQCSFDFMTAKDTTFSMYLLGISTSSIEKCLFRLFAMIDWIMCSFVFKFFWFFLYSGY